MSADENQKNRSLRFSYYNGLFASSMTGLTQEYFTPFLLLLDPSAKYVGYLNAFPNLFAALAQLKSADLTERFKSRKLVVNFLVLLQAVTLLVMGVMAYLKVTSIVAFIVMAVLFAVFAALANPAWASFMVDLVPVDKRGEYFGWRNKNLGYTIVGSTFLAGYILHRMETFDIFDGFAIVFGLAFFCRIVSWFFLEQMYEPPLHYGKEHYFTFFRFLSKLKKSNFAQFVLFVSLMSFSVNLSAPFFAVFMLRDLSFSYLLYTMATIFTTITLYTTMNRWGRHADKVGNLKIIRFTTPLISLIPILWIFSQNTIYLFAVQIFSGFLWAGFNLCSTNFIYDAVTPEKRTRCVAYFNVLNGIAVSLGAILGGLMLPHLPPLFGHNILSLFLISGLLRFVIAIFMPIRLKEVRSVKSVGSNELFFSMIGVKPILGVERKTIRFES